VEENTSIYICQGLTEPPTKSVTVPYVRGLCKQGAIGTRLEQDRLVRETNP